MFLHEVLQLLSPGLLALLVILHAEIMLDDLLNAAPEQLDHLRHVVSLALYLSSLVLQLLFFFNLALAQLFAAHSDLLLGIALLLLALPVKVLLHPEHLLYQVLMMGFVGR